MQLIRGVLKTQTDLMASVKTNIAGDTKADPAFQICRDILIRLPQIYNLQYVSEKYPVLYTNSMNTVLRQELIR